MQRGFYAFSIFFFLGLLPLAGVAQSTPPTPPVAAAAVTPSGIAVMRVYEGRGVYGSGIVVTYEDGKTDVTNLKDFKSMDNYVPMTQQIQLAIAKLYQAGYALIQATGGGGISETDANRTGLIVQTFIFRKQ